MAELVLELFSEEIPARMQQPMARLLKETFEKKLEAENVYVSHIKTFVTPRRLVLFADGLSLTQESNVTEKRGPRTDAPQAAIDGFVKTSGLKLEQLTKKVTDKGEFYFAITNQKGRPTKDILKAVIENILSTLTWPKSMRWADNKIRWVRPLKNIACLFGGEVLPVEFGHLKANDKSFGHRFLAPTEFKIKNFEEFEKELKKRFVILNHEARKKLILETSNDIAKKEGLELVYDEALLDEVTGLVEYPEVLVGQFDEKFMAVPDEVLVTTIKINQKYFCLRKPNGRIVNKFVFVSNLSKAETGDFGLQIIAGNERVIRARLSDAVFFFETDKAKKLEHYNEKLPEITFHAKLGTVAEKVKRIEEIAEEIAEEIVADEHKVERAAKLCKADLTTGMVGEFPELQGIMGFYYANHSKEANEVAIAIKEHYSPVGPNDSVPTSPVSICVALADKIDSLVGLFAAQEKPTGSKDPFALRRAALGIIRIILENKLIFELAPIIAKAAKEYPSKLFKEQNRDDIVDEVIQFLSDRLKHQLKAENFRDDIINAVLSDAGEFNIFELHKRVEILSDFVSSNTGATAIAAYKRGANILRIEEKKDKTTFAPKPSKSGLREVAEQNLFEALEQTRDLLEDKLDKFEFNYSLNELTKLSSTCNAFFDNIIINIEDKKLRENRLKLVSMLKDTFLIVANFEALEG
jgi:glycyl-tRNA synthetase beta chain